MGGGSLTSLLDHVDRVEAQVMLQMMSVQASTPSGCDKGKGGGVVSCLFSGGNSLFRSYGPQGRSPSSSSSRSSCCSLCLLSIDSAFRCRDVLAKGSMSLSLSIYFDACTDAPLTQQGGGYDTGFGAGKGHAASSASAGVLSISGGARQASKDKLESKDGEGKGVDVCEEALILLMLTHKGDRRQGATRLPQASGGTGNTAHLDVSLHLGSMTACHQEEALSTMALLVARHAAVYSR